MELKDYFDCDFSYDYPCYNGSCNVDSCEDCKFPDFICSVCFNCGDECFHCIRNNSTLDKSIGK
jgi:hypothetical protein